MKLFKNQITGDIFLSDNPNQSEDCVEITNTIEGDGFLLERAKNKKLVELAAFHESDAVKKLTIKFNEASTYIRLESDYRYLIDEQINLLELRIKSGEINPTWNYQNGITLTLDLNQLSSIRLYIGELVDHNFHARRFHEKAVIALSSLEQVESYNFNSSYRLNQILNFN